MSRSNARGRILDAALDLFSDKGFDATGVQEIVSRAGVTKGALYHHFASKEDILFDLYSDVLAGQLADLDRILGADRDPMWKMRTIVESLVVSTAASAKAAAVVTREMSHVDSGRHQLLKRDWRRYQDSVRALIRDAQADGMFASAASPEVVSWAVFGVVTSLHTWYRPDGPKSPRDIAQELSDLVLGGLAPKEDHV